MFTTLSPPPRSAGEEGLRWAERIERALRGEGVRTLFQPIVDLTRHLVVGARFAIDNAGTGQTGLRQLLEVRPEVLKLDRGIVDGIDKDEAKEALVEMIELFSRRIGAVVLAEGVETTEEANCLRSLGIPLAQGYLFGRPAEPWLDLPAATILRLEQI